MSGMFGRPNVDSRLEGWVIKDVPAGASTHYYMFSEKCQFNGVEIMSSVSNLRSHITFSTEYTSDGLTWSLYKKFGKEVPLFPGQLDKKILFPTNPGPGVTIKLDVFNAETEPIDIAMTLYKFTDLENVDVYQGQSGADW